ncbi:MAG: T9SS type A sorting domain-containing protein [Owenweeksia sp.]|nr:T9SS type A sorting domain-containing protein [Owenweeksia sp.]
MKQLYTFIFLLATLPFLGQVPDKTVTDCNNFTQSIHGVFATGQVLMVVSNGLDCSICRGEAPSLQNFASQNSTNITVWGAMTNRYSGAIPPCSEVNTWVNDYNWNDIYSFIDSSQHWFKFGTPRYYVYDPGDSSLAYEGISFSTAKQTARSLANSVGNRETGSPEFSLHTYQGFLEVQQWPYDRLHLTLLNITGKEIRNLHTSNADIRISTLGLAPGVYLVSLSNGKGFKEVRKVYVQ